MLIKLISNPWFQLKVLYATLQGEEKSHLAKKAFLYVIAEYNAYSNDKMKMLSEIAEMYPDITDAVCDEEMLEYFQYFCAESHRRHEIVSPAELDWVNAYVRNAAIRVQIEKLIYRRCLGASSHWDEMRQEFSWTISDSDKLELARETLQDKGLGSERKMELAKEFWEPWEEFAKAYYRKLLYDRHYDKAAELGVDDPADIVYDVIVANIDNGYFRDALDVTQRFLPDRTDLIEEIRQIIAVFK